MIKKILVGLSMAFGNFTVLPNPYKRWDEGARNLMLMLLPVVGAVIGGIFILLLGILGILGVNTIILAAVGVFYLFKVTGYIHLDGFMDVTDASLSRRPLEERQRILKDPTVGAFAVCGCAFLLLMDFAALISIFAKGLPVLLAYVPIFSRCAGAWQVLHFSPAGYSQYVESHEAESRSLYGLGIIVIFLVLTLPVVWSGMSAGEVRIAYQYAGLLAVQVLVSLGSGAYARRQLGGGMNGDIAGYTICYSELAGLLFLAVL